MTKPLDFKNAEAFRVWLQENHASESGKEIYMYKKGYEDQGLTYEDAVRTALCYGWIDAVTNSYDEVKFIQYFAPRRKTSKWSLSNMIRMRELIESGQMTEHGLNFFDVSVLDDLDERIEAEQKAKKMPVELPDYFLEILYESDSYGLFEAQSKSVQRRYVSYIQDAKQEATKIRRCHKIVGILNGEKNNL